MSTARQILSDRLHAFNEATSNPSLQNDGLGEILKNEVARYLRNGLQIMIFCTIEDFLRNRTTELFSSAEFTMLRFSDLTANLQKMFIIDSLDAILVKNKMDNKPIGDQISFCSNEIKIVSNCINQSMPFSSYAFGKIKSNLSYDEIDTLLLALKVSQPATGIASVAMRCGYPMPAGAKTSFKNFALKRHLSAHDSNYAVEVTDLVESIRFAQVFCLAFDFLATVAVKRICSSVNQNEVNGTSLKMRVIRSRNSAKWAEFPLVGATPGKTRKIHHSLMDARRKAWENCKNEELLLEQNDSGLPTGWRI